MSDLEQVLQALAQHLEAIENLVVLRNAIEAERLETVGNIAVLFDGSSRERRANGVGFEFTWGAELDLVIVDPDGATRDAELDRIVGAFGDAIAADKFLGGLVDYCEVEPPADSKLHDIYGAPGMKLTMVPIAIYFTSSRSTG